LRESSPTPQLNRCVVHTMHIPPPLTAHTLHCSKGTAGGTAQLAQLIQRPSYTVWAGSRMHQGLVVPPHTNPWQWQTQCMHATAHTMVHNLTIPLHAHYREHPLPTLTVHTMHCSKGTQLGGGGSAGTDDLPSCTFWAVSGCIKSCCITTHYSLAMVDTAVHARTPQCALLCTL
jgi:hypothetical protein